VAHSTLLSAGLLLAGLTMAEQVSTTALPSAPTVQYPNVGSIKYTIDSAAAKGVITQTDPTNIIKWESFDIGKDAKLQVIQPSANSVLLNKVEGSNPSYIFGQLSANGRVYIYNPDGVVFGPKSVVNVNTLIASSL
jgi:filamentous hemagglutinin family protein